MVLPTVVLRPPLGAEAQGLPRSHGPSNSNAIPSDGEPKLAGQAWWPESHLKSAALRNGYDKTCAGALWDPPGSLRRCLRYPPDALLGRARQLATMLQVGDAHADEPRAEHAAPSCG